MHKKIISSRFTPSTLSTKYPPDSLASKYTPNLYHYNIGKIPEPCDVIHILYWIYMQRMPLSLDLGYREV